MKIKFLFVIFFVLVFFCSAFSANAMTQVEKQALIKQITEQIAILQKQLNDMLAAEKAVTVTKPFSGTFDLAVNPKYASQIFSVPRANVKLADFILENKTTEDVNINNIEVYVDNQYLKNIYVVCGQTKSSINSEVVYKNIFSVNCKTSISQIIKISVFADVNYYAPLNHTIKTNVLVSGISAQSANQVATNSNLAQGGQTITLGAESLAVSSETISSLPKIIVADQKIDVAKFKFSSTGDSFVISELRFNFSQGSLPSVVSSIELKDADTKNILYTSSNVNFLGLNIPVDVNSTKSIIISLNLGKVSVPENSNINIAPILVYAKTKNSRGDIVEKNSEIKGADIYVYKTWPTFFAEAKTTGVESASVSDVYDFKISADSKGDVAVKQITFSIAISDPNRVYPSLRDLSFFRGSKDISSEVLMGEMLNNRFIFPAETNGLAYGTHNLILVFNKEEIVPAGTSASYTLKAKTNNFIKSASAVTYLLSDSERASVSYLRSVFMPNFGLAAYPYAVSVAYFNTLWSDKSASGFPVHNDLNGYSTKDWYNGYNISSANSQTIKAK